MAIALKVNGQTREVAADADTPCSMRCATI